MAGHPVNPPWAVYLYPATRALLTLAFILGNAADLGLACLLLLLWIVGNGLLFPWKTSPQKPYRGSLDRSRQG